MLYFPSFTKNYIQCNLMKINSLYRQMFFIFGICFPQHWCQAFIFTAVNWRLAVVALKTTTFRVRRQATINLLHLLTLNVTIQQN